MSFGMARSHDFHKSHDILKWWIIKQALENLHKNVCEASHQVSGFKIELLKHMD